VQLTLPKIVWFLAALGLAWGINEWRTAAAARGLEAAQDGDRRAAEGWIDRALRESKCELHGARGYLAAEATRKYVRRPDYVDLFVDKLAAGGASAVEICESDALGFRFAHYLLVTLPDEASKHERLIADAQSLVRRDAVVYRGVTSVEVEEIVRTSTLVGTRRVLVDLPVEAD
jgi:hypothetical protein